MNLFRIAMSTEQHTKAINAQKSHIKQQKMSDIYQYTHVIFNSKFNSNYYQGLK